jgi:hypothetical protein
MVVEADKTWAGVVRTAIARLDDSGAQIVGVLLTKVNERGGRYGYEYAPYRYGIGKNDNEILMIPQQAG